MNSDHNRHVQPPAPPAPPLRLKKPRPVLRIHKRAFFLLAFYISIILIPWIITAILSYHPLTKSSWTYAPGISYKDYKLMQRWARAIPTLNAIATILAIPIISSIIAQAAVVFAQRRHPGQQLSVRQLFKLADRSWGNWGTLHKMLSWNEPGHARVNWFFIACTGLVVLGAVQFPLYQLLAPWKDIVMPTCEDTKYIDYGVGKRTCDFDNLKFKELGYTQVGIDLEPAQMAIIPQQYILPRMRNDLATLHENQVQSYIWKSPLSYSDTVNDYEGLRGFVAALPSDTTTGVLREHIMRFNSTALCVSLEMSEYPATCSGENPFQASFDYKGLYSWGRSPNISTVDICAPGDLGKHPWAVSRNRQDLSEEVFLKFTGGYDDGVLHCTGRTTRGYFELGNIHNGDTFGPLLEKWPSSGSSLDKYQFNDYMGFDWSSESSSHWGDGYMLSEEDTDRGGAIPIPDRRTERDYEDTYPPNTYTNMSGPLMTSVLAFFGNNSWVHGVANLTSERDEDRDELATMYADQPALLGPLCDVLPLRHFTSSLGNTYKHDDCSDSLLELMMTYSDHMSRWSRNSTAAERLSVAMFLANQAALTSHTAGILPWQRDTGREIYTAPGIKVWKPSVSLPSLIVLSTIVGVQVIGLLWLGWWIYKWPTWTRTLDAMAIARVAASIDPSVLPPFRTIGQKDWEKLAHIDGLIGAKLQDVAAEQQRSPGGVVQENATEADIEMRALSVASTVGKEPTNEVVPVPIADASSVTLGLGASGVVSKRWGKQTPRSDQGAESV